MFLGFGSYASFDSQPSVMISLATDSVREIKLNLVLEFPGGILA